MAAILVFDTQGYSSGHGTRREKGRQIEKEMGRQHIRIVRVRIVKPSDRLRTERNGGKWLPQHP